MFFNKNNVMKEKKKSLKTLLEGDFRPLEESKEGKLKGGFGLLRKMEIVEKIVIVPQT